MHQVPFFEQAALTVLEQRSSCWSDPREAGTQLRVFQTYVFPHIGKCVVSEVTLKDVLGVLLPIWHAKPAQARRVLRQVRYVLRWARWSGFRHDDLGVGQIVLALGPIRRTVAHRPSVSHSEVASVIGAVHRLGGWTLTQLAFEFLVLAAVRSSEVRGARWEEIDLDSSVWIIPGERMKNRRSHVVPLSPHAVALLLKAREVSGTQGLVFPSRSGRQLTSQAFSYPLHRLGVGARPPRPSCNRSRAQPNIIEHSRYRRVCEFSHTGLHHRDAGGQLFEVDEPEAGVVGRRQEHRRRPAGAVGGVAPGDATKVHGVEQERPDVDILAAAVCRDLLRDHRFCRAGRPPHHSRLTGFDEKGEGRGELARAERIVRGDGCGLGHGQDSGMAERRRGHPPGARPSPRSARNSGSFRGGGM